MNSRKLFIGCGIVVALGLGIVIIGMIASYLFPKQSLPGATSISVNINQPLNGEALLLNEPVSVYVQAWGDQPLQDIQLLVDGVPQPKGDSSPAGDKEMIASWAFTADKEGTHTFLARANAQNGQAGVSNAVNVNILPSDQMPIPLVEGGANAPLVINDETGGAGLEGGIPAPPPFPDGGGVNNPPPFPEEPSSQEPPAEPAQQPADNLISIEFSFLIQTFLGASLPAAPTLDGGAKLCDGILVAQDNSTDEAGFFLYRLDPGQPAFKRVATLDGKTGKSMFSYHDPGLAQGSHSYYLSAFSAAGEAPSNIVTIQISDAQCAAVEPQSLSFESLKLKTTTPVDKVYCYISADGGPWKRIPAGQNSFIQPANGEFDLNPYLGPLPLPKPPQTQLTINIECWGWNGGTLTYLGASQQTWNPNEQLVLIGQLFEIYGTGGAPDKLMGGGWPQTDLIAAPYNATITRDPKVCKKHSSSPQDEKDCKQAMANSEYGILVWIWHQYGSCNPGLQQNCNMKYQPADGFFVHRIMGEQRKFIDQKSPITSTWSSMPLFLSSDQNSMLYVRAFSNSLTGESGDSNHVYSSLPSWETTINPTSMKNLCWMVYGDNSSPPQWFTFPPNDVLSSGYAFGPLGSSFLDVWCRGGVTFTLPENLNIQSARLHWKNRSLSTRGPGKNDVTTSCQVRLGSHVEGDNNVMPLPNFSLYNNEDYDVSQQVWMSNKMNSKKAIDFWFLENMDKKPSVRPDTCMWDVHYLELTLYYSK